MGPSGGRGRSRGRRAGGRGGKGDDPEGGARLGGGEDRRQVGADGGARGRGRAPGANAAGGGPLRDRVPGRGVKKELVMESIYAGSPEQCNNLTIDRWICRVCIRACTCLATGQAGSGRALGPRPSPSLPPRPSDPEAAAATAALLGVGVEELEAAANELVGKVQLEPVQVEQGLGVDDAPDPLLGVVVHLVVVGDVFGSGEVHHVRHSRASAGADPHPQHQGGGRIVLLGLELQEPRHGRGLYVDHVVVLVLVLVAVLVLVLVPAVLYRGGRYLGLLGRHAESRRCRGGRRGQGAGWDGGRAAREGHRRRRRAVRGGGEGSGSHRDLHLHHCRGGGGEEGRQEGGRSHPRRHRGGVGGGGRGMGGGGGEAGRFAEGKPKMAMVAEAIFRPLLASLVASRPKSVAGVLYYIYENKRVKERRKKKKEKKEEEQVN